MSRPFMPFYDGDWMRDTAHLDDHQERAYFRLVMFYWAVGKLPTEECQLARIARMTPSKWKKNHQLLAAFFGPNWIHYRIEKELEKNRKFLEKQRLNGAKPKAKHEPNTILIETRAPVPQPQPYKIDTGTPYLPTVLPYEDSQIEPKEKNTKKKKTALEILSSAVTDKTAQDVIDHRKALRKPLTPRAAELLADKFNAFGDPERAAEAMIANGWIGFKPGWMTSNGHGRGPPANGNGRSNGIEGYARLLQEDIENDKRSRASSNAGISDEGAVHDVHLLQPRR